MTKDEAFALFREREIAGKKRILSDFVNELIDILAEAWNEGWDACAQQNKDERKAGS